MDTRLLKLSAVVTNHTNFHLDAQELKIYYKGIYDSSYNKIKDIVHITEDLNRLGINHEVHDEYIQAYELSLL